jgi:hypothetical protein
VSGPGFLEVIARVYSIRWQASRKRW